MTIINNKENYLDIIEKQVIDGLSSFFGNPANHDSIILTANCKAEEFRKKLEKITVELVEIENNINAIQERNSAVVEEVFSGIITDVVGTLLLRTNGEQLEQLELEREKLHLQETLLCKQIVALERFEERGLWCNLYCKNLSTREKTDLLKLFIERVDIYVKMP